MRIFFLLVISIFLLYAQDQFQYIQPISVEVQPKVKRVKKPKIVVEVVKTQKPAEKIVLDKNITKTMAVVEEKLDADEDGVEDAFDKCPNTAKGFSVDALGCPQTATLHVTFQPDKYSITSSMDSEINKFVRFLKENKNYQVVIYGYTDSIGEKKANKILSQKRADAVKNELIKRGISATKLTAIGRGEENPIASNMYKIGREKNRRIEIELIQ